MYPINAYKTLLKTKKLNNEVGVAREDKRGKKVHSNKISDRQIEIIKEHICKLPRYTSHYTRNKTPNRKFLPQDCNLKEMYKLYLEFFNMKNKKIL